MKNDEEEENLFGPLFPSGRNFVLGSVPGPVPGTVVHPPSREPSSSLSAFRLSFHTCAFCEEKTRGAALRDYPFTFFVSFLLFI